MAELLFDLNGQLIEPGRYRLTRKMNVHSAALADGMLAPTTGLDTGAVVTWRAESDTASATPPGLILTTSATTNNTATIHYPLTNLSKMEACRLRFLSGASISGNSRDIEFGFTNSLTAPTSGFVLRQKAAETNAKLVVWNATGVAGETTNTTEFNWNGSSGARFDLSLWILPKEKRILFGQSPDGVDRMWLPGSALDTAATGMANIGLYPYFRCTTRSAVTKATLVNEFALDTWYL